MIVDFVSTVSHNKNELTHYSSTGFIYKEIIRYGIYMVMHDTLDMHSWHGIANNEQPADNVHVAYMATYMQWCFVVLLCQCSHWDTHFREEATTTGMVVSQKLTRLLPCNTCMRQ